MRNNSDWDFSTYVAIYILTKENNILSDDLIMFGIIPKKSVYEGGGGKGVVSGCWVMLSIRNFSQKFQKICKRKLKLKCGFIMSLKHFFKNIHLN